MPSFKLPTSLAGLLVLMSWVPAAAQTLGAGDVSLRPAATATLAGQWTKVADTTAAGGTAVWFPNAGAAKLVTASANPSSYFELSFNAQAGIPYRLWVRLRAQNNDWANDSVFVQFSGTTDAANAPIYRIGTTSAAEVNLEDCKGCGIANWGWQDNGWGTGVLGPAIYFAASGTQVLRVQSREDGAIIDQIILSPSKFIAAAPGGLKNDATIYPSTSPPPPTGQVTLVRGPYLQQAGSDRATVVWATREAGAAEVRYSGAAISSRASAVSRLVPASVTGFPYNYYQHEALVAGLSPSTTYTYDTYVGGVDATPGTYTLRTASAVGTGAVRFIAFGDSGTGSPEQQQLSVLMNAETFDIALHAGDIAYGNTTGTGDASYISFQNWFFGIYPGWLGSHPFFPVEGNHDSRPTNNDGAAYLDLFSLPRNGASAAYPDHAERYYSFDYGPVHFVALDTEFTFQDPARRAEQVAWLGADLASTSQPWKIAYFHRPPYSAGAGHGSDLTVRSTFGPLLERYGVALVISGHEHDYERTNPMLSGTTGSPVTYLVTGGGGAPLYASGTGAWTAYSSSQHHYLRASADACAIHVEAVDLNGSVFDRTDLNRCASAASEIVVYGADATIAGSAWGLVADSTAAAGRRLSNPDAGAAKAAAAQAQPASYFELPFNAVAGVPYRLWLRGKAAANYWANDSVFVQFSGSVDSAGTPAYRIGTTTATIVNLEDCAGCGVSGWGWQDNGYGAGVMGPLIYFQTSGPQRLRVQVREDGLSVDQIVLSPSQYLTNAPGALKNDATILPRR